MYFSGFFLRPASLLCFVGRIHPTKVVPTVELKKLPTCKPPTAPGFEKVVDSVFWIPKKSVKFQSRWWYRNGLPWMIPKKNTNIFSHTKMSFIAIAVYIFDSWYLDCSFNQYSIILKHMIMWLRLDVLVGFIDTWAFDWIVSTPHPATVTTRIIPLFRFPKSELDLHLWRLHPGGGGWTEYIPGTCNIPFKLVVSIGWFQLFTWKMVVSPNIHEKNGCLEFLWYMFSGGRNPVVEVRSFS